MSKKKTSDKKTALAESCVKVQVTIKTYSGIKADTKARNELADIKDANQQLVKVSKHLLDPEYLKPVIKIGKQFRNQVVYKNTLPWIDADDQALGGGKSYVSYDRQVKKQKNTGLGNLFNESDYLSADELKARYIFDHEIGIINEFNADDIRVSISEDVKSNIVANAQARENNVKQNADRHTAKQLVSNIEKLANALEKFDPNDKTKHPLRDSSFNDLRDMLDTIDDYLLTDDDDLKSTVADLQKDIAKAKSQSNLKKDDKARKSTAKKLRQAEKQVKVSDTAKGLF